MLDLLKCYVHDHKEKWELYLPLVEYAYNTTVHSSTRKASFEIVEGGKKVPPILHTKDKIFELTGMLKIGNRLMQKLSMLFKELSKSIRRQQINIADLWTCVG